MRWPRSELPTLFLAVVISSWPATALGGDQWWCPNGQPLWTVPSIPVWIHPDLGANLLHPNGTTWSNAELQAEVQFVLERFRDQSSCAMPPLVFAGFEPPGTHWNAPAPSTSSIAIRPNLNGVNCSTVTVGYQGYSQGVKILIGPSTGSCTLRYSHWFFAAFESSTKTFGGGLMHELTHAIGQIENFDVIQCGNTPGPCIDNPGEPLACGQMAEHGLYSEQYEQEYSDVMALRARYGVWPNDGRLRRESADALTWTTLGFSSFASAPYAAAAWGNSTMPIIVTDGTLTPHLWLWTRSLGALSDWGPVEAASIEQFGPVAVGEGASYRYAFYVSEQAESYAVKYAFHSYHSSATSRTAVGSLSLVSRQGRGGAYDPKTGRLVHTWRGKDNEIIVANGTSTGSPVGASALGSFKAAYTPSIACGDSSIYYNCIIVWTSAVDHYHFLKWTHFRVYYYGADIGWGLLFSPAGVYTSGYIQYGPPAVTYVGPAGGPEAFVVGFKNPGQCFYTLRKSAADNSIFVDERSHCSGSNRFNGVPIIGSTLGWAEAWTVWTQ